MSLVRTQPHIAPTPPERGLAARSATCRPPARGGLLALAAVLAGTAAIGSGGAAAESRKSVERDLVRLLEQRSPNGDKDDFILPDSARLADIPQDPNNVLTPAKVRLGRLLFHETAVGTDATDAERSETYSCASCHHVGAGFKSGIPQGIADGGTGFGRGGEGRLLADGLVAEAPDGAPNKPDLQPVASPATLNTAYQDVMLWNGALGGREAGVNGSIDKRADFGPPGLFVNRFDLSGLETQVLAGTKVHRLDFGPGSIVHRDRRYRRLYRQAFGGSDADTGPIPEGSSVTRQALGAAKAIAAYERTLLANRAPFQRWLRGRKGAMNTAQLRGARLFFGDAGCADCHTGPALSSWPGAAEDEMFFAVGFADFDTADARIHGQVGLTDSLGRGGFTDQRPDDYRFKVPQLYNLADADVFGHGASFSSVRDVIEHKNVGRVQNGHGKNLDPRVKPLGLSRRDIRDLTAFVEKGLRDRSLGRYVPDKLPSGNCFPVADIASAFDLRCF